MVRVLQGFHGERVLRQLTAGIVIEKAQDYYPEPTDHDYARKNDAPWIRRFAGAGGRAIISGNTKMLKVPHEKLALSQTGLVVVFLPGQWSGWRFCQKCSLLFHWWPVILDTIKKAPPGFYMVPMSWPANGEGELRHIPSGDLALVQMEQQLAVRERVRAERRTRKASATAAIGDLFRGK